ncbi:MAG TPA: rod shape-determining protein MreD [Ignavibacteriaceae bacterium]|nr:rod shape-determining protein MreD [Ignavibacteriaceae bacterium]
MRLQFILAVLFFFPVLLVQTTIIPLISIGNITPNIIIILLVFYTIKNGQIFGTLLGFVFGFLFDLITGSILGSSMIAKTIAGFSAGYFSSETKRAIYLKPANFSLIVFLSSLFYSIIYSLFSTLDFTTTVLNLLFEHALLPALFTAVISLFLIFFYPKRKLF